MRMSPMRANNTKKILLIGISLLLLAETPTLAQGDVAMAQIHLRAANDAYRQADYETFTAELETALALNPHSIYTRYNLACGYARTGHHAKAKSILRQLVDWRIDFGYADDVDLASLHDDPDFAELNKSLEQKLTPVRSSRHRFTSEQLGLIPEGIAIDITSGRMFISSMRTGDIYVVDDEDRMARFATISHEGKLAAIGLVTDAARGMLWAIGSSFDTVEDFDASAPTRTGLFGFDLRTGQLVQKFIGDESFTGFNDVTVAPSGDIYLSGGELGIVRQDSDVIEHFETEMKIYGSNGIAMDPDGKHLFVSSYPVGVAVIDLQTGASSWLQAPSDATLYGIDGLYWYAGDLIAVQNGVNPWRLIRIRLDKRQTSVSSVEFIEFANDEFEPTTGAIVDGAIHYVGQGPQPHPVPANFPPALARFAGKTIVMTAPLH